jgi:TPR repeat protein
MDMRTIPYLSLVMIAWIGAGCAHSRAPIDLRVTPALAPQSGTPVYIRSVSIREGQAGSLLPEGRSSGDLIREVVADVLHKRGFVLQSDPAPGTHELDITILRFGIKSERGRTTPNPVLQGIAIMGYSTIQGRDVQYTAFPIEVLLEGPIFEGGKYGFVGSKVYKMKGEEYPEFVNKGLARFREAMSRKIPGPGGGKATPMNRRAAREVEAMEERASLIEQEAADLDRLREGAAAGKAEDQYRLSLMLRRGSRYKLLEAAPKEAQELLQAAAAQGHGDSLWQLFSQNARPHSESQTTAEALVDAEKWLRLAALHENMYAQVFLGSMFYQSINNPQDRQSLFSIWTAQRDSPRFSKRFQHDNARAYAWMCVAASQSEGAADPSRLPAIHRLATMHRDALARNIPEHQRLAGEQLAAEIAAKIAASGTSRNSN